MAISSKMYLFAAPEYARTNSYYPETLNVKLCYWSLLFLNSFCVYISMYITILPVLESMRENLFLWRKLFILYNIMLSQRARERNTKKTGENICTSWVFFCMLMPIFFLVHFYMINFIIIKWRERVGSLIIMYVNMQGNKVLHIFAQRNCLV